MVFYRKYRPQRIGELDNESVRQNLYSIFSKSDFPHAFLFTGPKGLGKTSTARIVAKVINCEKHIGLKGLRGEKEIEPCNKCEQCLSISNGNNLDVLEIDGASNRGIDEIRDLKEKINLAPFKAIKKIYIIDEVHMLTTEAFNALLKTLEEPPSHAVFILCTTEQHKVPATIASRCSSINFTRATDEELVHSLQRIVKAEEIKADKEALLEIAKLSDGSFRDGAKLLEEVAVFAGQKNITADLVNEKFNNSGIADGISQMLDALINKDAKKGIEICKELQKQGMDFKYFIEELMDKLHLMLLQKVGVEKTDKEPVLELSEIRKLFQLLTTAYLETKTAVLAQMPLEMVILEWGESKDALRSPSEESRGAVAKGAGEAVGGSQTHVIQDARESIDQSQNSSRSLNENRQSAAKKDNDMQKPVSNSFTNGSTSTPVIKNNALVELINEVKIQNPLVAGLLRSCSAEDVKNSKLNIIASSRFHKEKLEDEKAMKILSDCATKIFGKEIEVNILGGDK
jgi:DNA polymerase-3 subunit gamma/tau